jgi:hypothetical protein
MSAADPREELDNLFTGIESGEITERAVRFFDKYDEIARAILATIESMQSNGVDAPTPRQSRALQNIYLGACYWLGRDPDVEGQPPGDEEPENDGGYIDALDRWVADRSKEERVSRRERYETFLRSRDWQEIRRGAIERSKGVCSQCGASTSLQVHHRTCDRFGGRELSRDLVVLCQPCHAARHDIREAYLAFLRRDVGAVDPGGR